MDEVLATEPQAVDSFQAEAALMAIGLEAVLKGVPKFNVAQQEEASRTTKAISREVMAFLSTSDGNRVERLPDFDYKKVSGLLNGTGTEDQAAALFDAVGDHDLGLAVANTATRIIHLLQQALPRRVRQTIAGSVVEPPSDMELARFARMWSVAMDPMIVLRDLNEGSLSRDMVQALEAFYPAVYAKVKAAVVEAVVTLKTKRPTWDLEGKRDRLLRMLLLAPDHDVDLAAAFQAMYQQAMGPQQGQAPKPSVGKLKLGEDESLLTPGQKQ